MGHCQQSEVGHRECDGVFFFVLLPSPWALSEWDCEIEGGDPFEFGLNLDQWHSHVRGVG